MYRLIFEHSIPGFSPSDTVQSAAQTAFDRLVDAIRLGIATSHIQPGEPHEIAHRIWAACHGAISLELHNIGFITDHDTHYTALINTVLRGIATTNTPPETELSNPEHHH